ncbi:hypothetical protein JHD48_01225 [Sulfurimonas sp. SAG-AH-194-I05]|nr:hypothetical protein [Sulfurimonas sp. SAG-AH-194-I05]MDF1874350.1 hypothetical protein [Sulfurimonas sp. SAG-AH-194-I05]
MELDTTTWMLIFFMLSFGLSMWKIYAFLPNKELEDDDTTKESQEELIALVIRTIQNAENSPSENELFESVKKDENFDAKHFWRFNQNKLNQLLNGYYIKNPNLQSIEDIYKTKR